ncbi:unnamed protein product, partial [Iphiclides podalirius]
MIRIYSGGVIRRLFYKYVPVIWAAPPRAWLACSAAATPRRPPPPLDEPHGRLRPYFWRRDGESFSAKRLSSNGTLEVSRKRDGGGDGVYQCGVRHQSGIVLGNPLHLKFALALDKHLNRMGLSENPSVDSAVMTRIQGGHGNPA